VLRVASTGQNDIMDRIRDCLFKLEQGREALVILQHRRFNVHDKKPRLMDRATYKNPRPFVEQVIAEAEETYRIGDEYRKTTQVPDWFDHSMKELWSKRYTLQLDLQVIG